MRLRRLKVYYMRLKDTLRVHPIWWTVLEVLSVFLVLGHVSSSLVAAQRSTHKKCNNLQVLALGLYLSAQNIDGSTYTDKNWLTETEILTDYGDAAAGQNVLNAPAQIRYIVSFYWAVVTMATLGFGDIKPYTTHEVSMVTLCPTSTAWLCCVSGQYGYTVSHGWSVLLRLGYWSDHAAAAAGGGVGV